MTLYCVICMYIYIYTHIYAHTVYIQFLYIHIYIYIQHAVYIYIYIYIQRCIYVYIYIHTCIHTVVYRSGWKWALVPRTQFPTTSGQFFSKGFLNSFQQGFIIIVFLSFFCYLFRFSKLAFWAEGSAPLPIVSHSFNIKFNQVELMSTMGKEDHGQSLI